MKKLMVIAGPCVIESEEMVMQIAKQMKEICDRLDVEYYFKASFDKANRTSISSFRGPGIEEGIKILKKVKDKIYLDINFRKKNNSFIFLLNYHTYVYYNFSKLLIYNSYGTIELYNCCEIGLPFICANEVNNYCQQKFHKKIVIVDCL